MAKLKRNCNISLNDTSFHPVNDLIHPTSLKAYLQNVLRVESKHCIIRRTKKSAPKGVSGELLRGEKIPWRFRRAALTERKEENYYGLFGYILKEDLTNFSSEFHF